jgi:DNA-directed RNA polymerase subunit RPC12/RpoP
MSGEGLSARLEREAAPVECPICRHRQWLSAAMGRCEQCGSEIELFESREEAREALRLLGAGRVAYVVEAKHGLFAVVANRKFGGGR